MAPQTPSSSDDSGQLSIPAGGIKHQWNCPIYEGKGEDMRCKGTDSQPTKESIRCRSRQASLQLPQFGVNLPMPPPPPKKYAAVSSKKRHRQFLPGHPPTAQGSLELGEAYSSFGVATLNGGEEQGSIYPRTACSMLCC